MFSLLRRLRGEISMKVKWNQKLATEMSQDTEKQQVQVEK